MIKIKIRFMANLKCKESFISTLPSAQNNHIQTMFFVFLLKVTKKHSCDQNNSTHLKNCLLPYLQNIAKSTAWALVSWSCSIITTELQWNIRLWWTESKSQFVNSPRPIKSKSYLIQAVILACFRCRSSTNFENGVQWPNESLHILNGDLFDVFLFFCFCVNTFWMGAFLMSTRYKYIYVYKM